MYSRRVCLILTLVCLVNVSAVSPAWAWGRLGHRVIAKLAERHLTDRAKAEIKALLEPGESLADASTWARPEDSRQRPGPSMHGPACPMPSRPESWRW
jgi:S1/P1 Nuclease